MERRGRESCDVLLAVARAELQKVDLRKKSIVNNWKVPKLRKIPGKRVEKLTNHCLAIIKTSKLWGAFDKKEGGGQEYIFRPALTTGRQLNKQVEWVGGGWAIHCVGDTREGPVGVGASARGVPRVLSSVSVLDGGNRCLDRNWGWNVASIFMKRPGNTLSL